MPTSTLPGLVSIRLCPGQKIDKIWEEHLNSGKSVNSKGGAIWPASLHV